MLILILFRGSLLSFPIWVWRQVHFDFRLVVVELPRSGADRQSAGGPHAFFANLFSGRLLDHLTAECHDLRPNGTGFLELDDHRRGVLRSHRCDVFPVGAPERFLAVDVVIEREDSVRRGHWRSVRELHALLQVIDISRRRWLIHAFGQTELRAAVGFEFDDVLHRQLLDRPHVIAVVGLIDGIREDGHAPAQFGVGLRRPRSSRFTSRGQASRLAFATGAAAARGQHGHQQHRTRTQRLPHLKSLP